MSESNSFFLLSLVLIQIFIRSEGLQCFTCIDATSNEECNQQGRVVQCADNELSCQNEVRLSEGSSYRITKRCKQPLACENNQAQNDQPAWQPTQCNPEFATNSVCKCCCDTDLCNEKEMPCDERPTCNALPSLVDGKTECSNMSFVGSTCRFSCDLGFKLVGSYEASCIEYPRGVSWNSELPSCERATCSGRAPQSVPNGSVSCDKSNIVSSVCQFDCYVGYELVGDSRVVCQSSRNWSTEFPICTRITCKENELQIQNGGVMCSDQNFYGSRCFFECEPGYKLQGEGVLICQDYVWNNVAPRCTRGTMKKQFTSAWNNKEISSCGSPTAETCGTALSNPQNGSVVCTENNLSFSSCSYICGNGDLEKWELYGEESASCEWNGQTRLFEWTSTDTPCCAMKCPPHASVDLFLVLDSSSSVGKENWNKTLFFIKEVIEQFEISEKDALVAAIRYNSKVDTESEITIGQYTTKEATINAIVSLPYDGSGTRTGNALEYVLQNMLLDAGNRRLVKDFVFVVTDGISTDDVMRPARQLREFGATVLALGVVNKGGTLKKEDIAEIAGSPETSFLIESGFEGLSLNVADLIEKQLCGENPCV